EFVRNLPKRSKKHFSILNKCHNNTQGYCSPTNYIQPAVPNQESGSHCARHFRNGEENGVIPNGAYPSFSMFGVYFFEALVFCFFTGKNLDYFHSRNAFLHKGVQICHLVPNVFKSNFHCFLENAGRI